MLFSHRPQLFRNPPTLFALLAIACGLFSGPGATHAQIIPPRPWCSNVVIPQSYRFVSGRGAIAITQVDADVVILEQVARTTIDIQLTNRGSRSETAEVLIPVPEGAVVKGFAFQGQGKEPTAELLTKERAAETFRSIVAKLKDPALLEFAGYNLIRSSVFPVEANGKQRVRIVYEHLLEADGVRVDYVLPRSQSVAYRIPWNVKVEIRSKQGVAGVYSPTHQLDIRRGRTSVTAQTARGAATTPGPFQLSYLKAKGDFTATLFTYPSADPADGTDGYFLLFAGIAEQEDRSSSAATVHREITLVLDRSGSMSGEKLAQAQQAALQVLAGLEPDEAFNIIAYNDEVDIFSPVAVVKSDESMAAAREFIERLTAKGGTNLHDALAESLQAKPKNGYLPIVLFLTDGLPTVGQRSESVIRKLATESNPHQRRVFTFGVGYDVNTPLLDKIATSTRAFATFVLPKEDVETKVARVFKGLDGPVLTSPTLQVVNSKGKPVPRRVRDLLPNELADLYQGDQLIVLGRYRGNRPLNFVLTGRQGGESKTYRFSFPVKRQSQPQYAFVARLWAARKIGALTDQIRDLGAEANAAGAVGKIVAPAASLVQSSATSPPPVPAADPRVMELVDEIVRLSRRFGILTEYTSFLATDGTDLSSTKSLNQAAWSSYYSRAVNCRSGIGSVNQEFNNSAQRAQTVLNTSNQYWNAAMERVQITTVQQCNTWALFRRGDRWVDSRLAERTEKPSPDRTIEFGSPEFDRLLKRLVRSGEQAAVAVGGDILIEVDGETLLIRTPTLPSESAAKAEQ